jgi:hypothetical protein
VALLVAAAQFGHLYFKEKCLLPGQHPGIGATPSMLGCPVLGAVLVAGQAQIGGHLLLQSLLIRLPYGRNDSVLHLVAHLGLAMAWEAQAVDNQQIIIKVAPVIELLCMAHRGIP